MIAYDLPGVLMEEGPDWIRTSRLAGAAAPCVATGGKPVRWHFVSRAGGGCTAYLDGWKQEACRAPVLTSEGWWAHLPQELPPFRLRARTDIGNREVQAVTLRSGIVIGVPNAAAAPRSVVFTPEGGGLGGAVEEWVRDAWDLHMSRDVREDENGGHSIVMCAPEGQILRTIAGALLRAYAVTHEWLNEYAIIQEADFPAILGALWGLDPKALGDAAGASPCSPPGLCPICQSHLPSSQP